MMPLVTSMVLCSLSLYGQSWQKTANGFKFTAQGIDTEVGFYAPGIVRVHKNPEGKSCHKESQVVVKSPEEVKLAYGDTESGIEVSSSLISLTVNPKSGSIVFCNSDGDILLKDKDYGTSFSPKDDAGKESFQVRQAFVLDREEPIYGIGQVWDGKLNRRNSVHHLQNENTLTHAPYFMSPTKGYGVYLDNYSISDFADSPQELSFTTLGECDDYYFLYGETPDGIIARVRELTGKAPMLPLWAYGYFQSKDRYKTAEESLDVLRKYRDLKVPVDVVVQDWEYWPKHNATDSAWNAQIFDLQRFPDPKKWVDDIHSLNGKLLLVSWPGFGPATPQYKELANNKMLIDITTWPPNSGTRPYDAYNPEAREIYWKFMKPLSEVGNDGWWLDSTEPDHLISSVWHNKDNDYNLPTYLGSFRSVKNLYSYSHNKGISQNTRAAYPDKRVVILTRSGFIGQQRFGSNTWSGDVHSTWDVLKKTIPAAMNFTMMGIPNWNGDIGGYTGHGFKGVGLEGANDPAFQELYTRWTQFATFTPMMRSHGKRIPREIYNFGERGSWCFDAIEKMIKLRYRLLPYIYSTSWDVTDNDGTFMRALVMDFPHDTTVYDLGSQFMFGRSLLVTPVTQPSVSEWSVYLPAGTDWWDFWSNTKHSGGQNIVKKVNVDVLPLYVKSGSIVPFGPDVQYSTEKNWDNLEVRIYPGADGEFILYEDENDNYNYEKGVRSLIKFQWNDRTKTLSISDREGHFPGMLKKRNFNIVLVGNNTKPGDMPMVATKNVRYNGKKINIKL